MDQTTVSGIRAILTGGSVIGLIVSIFLLILGLMALFMPSPCGGSGGKTSSCTS